MICNLGVVIAFDLCYLLNPILFPTIILASAFGVCNVIGRAVTIASPIVADIPNPYPLVVLVVFSAICSLLPFKLKKNSEL